MLHARKSPTARAISRRRPIVPARVLFNDRNATDARSCPPIVRLPLAAQQHELRTPRPAFAEHILPLTIPRSRHTPLFAAKLPSHHRSFACRCRVQHVPRVPRACTYVRGWQAVRRYVAACRNIELAASNGEAGLRASLPNHKPFLRADSSTPPAADWVARVVTPTAVHGSVAETERSGTAAATARQHRHWGLEAFTVRCACLSGGM